MIDGWASRDIDVNGHTLHYLRTGGSGKTPLVLVHGFSDSGATWARVAREFEADFDIVMPDMIGHGRSSRFAGGASPDMPADLRLLVERLALERPVICGHSMGAMVSYQACTRFPELARALFLEDPPWFPSPESGIKPPDQWVGSGAASENPVAKWAKTLAGKSMGELLADCRRDNPSWPDELARVMCEAKIRLDQGIIDTLAGLLESAGSSWEATIASVSVPFEIVTGNSERGGIVTPSLIERIRALNPRVTVKTFPDVGHLIRFDAHDGFVAELREFLKPFGAADSRRG